MVGMLACFSVLGLYVETILQLYILVSSWNSGTLQASVFILLLVFLLGSFAVTSVASAVSVFSAFRFRDRVPAKVLCGCMHVGQAAFVWRLYRVLFFYDKRDWFELTGLRLVHVSVQSIPYIVLYGRLLVVDVSLLRPLPVLSLVVSLVSATVALCTYTLRRRLHETRLKDSLPSQPSKARRCIGLSLLVFGSTLCLTARLGAFALMSVEHNYWAILPFSIHLLVLLIMHFACFRAGIRSEKSETPVYRQVLERLAKAYLSTFELVEDNFQRVQCRYVAFYSVMLVENLVMAALWMLFSSMDYVARLLVAVGLLAMFLCALVIKFASCGLITYVLSAVVSSTVQRAEEEEATIIISIIIVIITIITNTIVVVIVVTLALDSTSQTSRKAHDSDDLANITSSSDDDSGGPGNYGTCGAGRVIICIMITHS
nr:hypothetical protein BaRGS_001689 [Batillaria attramentaria]